MTRDRLTEDEPRLIDLGARVDPRDRWGATPLEDARREDHEDVAELLRTNDGGAS